MFLVGLMTKFQVTESAYFLLTVDNLFDEQYFAGISVPYHGGSTARRATLNPTPRKEF